MNTEQLHQTMIEKCFNTMRAELRFNICALKSSYIGNTDVPNLQQRIKDNILELLRYSCLYWLTHFSEANRDTVERLMPDFLEDLQVLD